MRLLALGDRNPDFLTHREIDSTLKLLPADVDCRWVATDDPRARELASYDGVWLLPGTPYRDDAAAYAAIGHCLETGTAFLGTCGGFQYAAVALARARLGLAGAGHAESDPARLASTSSSPCSARCTGDRVSAPGRQQPERRAASGSLRLATGGSRRTSRKTRPVKAAGLAPCAGRDIPDVSLRRVHRSYSAQIRLRGRGCYRRMSAGPDENNVGSGGLRWHHRSP